MKRTTSVIAAAILAMATYAAHADSVAAPQYTKSQILAMMRTAHTENQYRTLASYFRTQQQEYEQKASGEKQEWERRSVNTTSLAAKYPRPVDSSKNRYEYFTYKAQEMEKQAVHYESLSASTK